MARAGVLVLAALVVGCASTPQQHLARLNPEDPAYETAECRAARTAAAGYNNHVAGRAAVGLASGLLGPFGIPVAAYADAKANGDRKAANAEVDRQCSTGLPQAPKADRRDCSLDSTGEVMICARS